MIWSGILFYYFLLYLKFDKIIIIILMFGLLVRMVYLFNTGFRERTFDVEGHVEYIQYVGDNYTLPEPSMGWETFQPPLYYITGAIIYKLSELSGLYYPRGLQVLSLVYYMTFLFFGIFIFQRIFNSGQNRDLFYLSSALLVFWPGGILHSIRIGNDVMSYMFYSMGLYFTIKWYDTDGDKTLYIASVFTALGIMTKSNSLCLVPVIGLLLLYRFFRKKKSFYLRKGLIVLAILLIAFSVNFIRTFNDAKNYAKSHPMSWIVLNVRDNPQNTKVGNSANNYIYFDIKTFMNEPFTCNWQDWGGRQYYWNYLLKTSLFGDFKFLEPIHNILGVVISFLLLIMICFFITGLCLFQKAQVNMFGILLLNMFFLLTASMIYRIKCSLASVGEFRFILPVLISFIPIYSYTMTILKEKKLFFLAYIGYISSWLFIILSFIFYLSCKLNW
jgi:hypothetical protein